MTGYYRDGEWITAVVGGPQESNEEAERACAEALKRIESETSTARHEIKELLTRYPSLKRDRPNHPLLPFAGYYAKEWLG